jgi:hypothetical protein
MENFEQGTLNVEGFSVSSVLLPFAVCRFTLHPLRGGDKSRPETENMRPEGSNLRPGAKNPRPEGSNLRPGAKNPRPEGSNFRPDAQNPRPDGLKLRKDLIN